MINKKDIENAILKAKNVLGGRALGSVQKFPSRNGRVEYATVFFHHKGHRHEASFWRKKGMKNWHFDSMVSSNKVNL